jgi:SAM-dependent methyltransferase
LESDEEAEEIDLDHAEEITLEADPLLKRGDPQLKGARQPRMQRRRKKRKEWWTEIFNDDYLSLLPEYTARDVRREVDFIEKTLDVPKGSLLLDLACGQGTQAVGLAGRGYRIVGVDLSLPMLARAGELAQQEGQKINFIHGDMCDLGFDKTFEAVYCVGTSFGYFDDATNAKVLDGIYRALKPGGRLLLELTNRDHAITDQPNLTWFAGGGCICMEETDFNYINSRLYLTRQLIMNETNNQVKHEFSVRLYSLHELGTMLHKAGFIVVKVAGHPATPGAFFGADSAQLIILSERGT